MRRALGHGRGRGRYQVQPAARARPMPVPDSQPGSTARMSPGSVYLPADTCVPPNKALLEGDELITILRRNYVFQRLSPREEVNVPITNRLRVVLPGTEQ